jgi:hypothetical protein
MRRDVEDGFRVWITVAGVVVLIALIVLLTRWVRSEAERGD